MTTCIDLGTVNGIALGEFEGLIRSAAGKLAGSSRGVIDADDLHSYGWIGLRRAAERFDASRGIPFVKWAAPLVANRMRDYLRTLDWVPRLERIRAKEEGRDVRAQYSNSLTYGPDEEESEAASSASTTFDEDGMLAARETAAFLFDGLSERDQRMAVMRFVEGRTLRECGERFGFSEGRALQICDRIAEHARSRKPGRRRTARPAEAPVWRPSAPAEGAVRMHADVEARPAPPAPATAPTDRYAFRRTPEWRAKQSAIQRAKWASKSAEQRAAHVRNIRDGSARWRGHAAAASTHTKAKQPAAPAPQTKPARWPYPVIVVFGDGIEARCATAEIAAELVRALREKPAEQPERAA